MNNRPAHLFLSESGDLFDTRKPEWFLNPPVRKGFARTHHDIETGLELRSTLRAGDCTFPGCYPIVGITSDGEMVNLSALAKDKSALYIALRDIRSKVSGRIVATDVYYEGETVQCVYTNADIESAYGMPEDEKSE